MDRSRIALAATSIAALVLAACAPQPPAGQADEVRLQLQWAPQAQFAGYFAAVEQGYFQDENLDVTIVPGGPEVIPQQAGSAENGPEFTISWVPKVLEAREAGSDLVNIAQVFQRSGTLSVAWADAGIDSPEDFAGKKVGVWDFGNEFEVTAAARAVGLEAGVDYEKVIQPFDMALLLNAADGCAESDTDCVDVAEAMIYNEYAQVLEAENPDTGELYQDTDLSVINYNDVGTAMLQDALFARASWLEDADNVEIAIRFLRASFRGWIYCRDNPEDCVGYTLGEGPTLGEGHQRWQMNEINALIWPSPDGIGILDPDLWQQTVDISLESEIIAAAPPAEAYRTDLATSALEEIDGDKTGESFQKGTVEVTPGGD